MTVNGGLGEGALVSGDTVSVDTIVNDDPAQARFEANTLGSADGNAAPEGTISGSLSTVRARGTYREVDITNLSDKDLVVNGIDVATKAAPAVTILADDVTLEFDIISDVAPTAVDILNQGAGEVRVAGLVNNPIGTTTVVNTGGDIVGAGGTLRTNRLDLRAQTGSVGSSDGRLEAELVQSFNRPTSVKAQALDDVFVGLQGRLRDTPEFASVFVDSIRAGGDIDVLMRAGVKEFTQDGQTGGVSVTLNSDAPLAYSQHFRPDDPTPQDFDPTVFPDPDAVAPVQTNFDFRALDGTSNRTLNAVVGAGDIRIAAAQAGATDTQINLFGIGDLQGSGAIDLLTNGAIQWQESVGNLRAGDIRSTANDVALTAAGSIVDALGDAGSDVTGVSLSLTASSGTVGTSSKDLDIDSSSPNDGGVSASATQGIFLTETAGAMRVAQAATTAGDVILTVPDSAAAGDDLVLLAGGTISSGNGEVTLLAGDDIELQDNSLVRAPMHVSTQSDNVRTRIGSRIETTNAGSLIEIDAGQSIAMAGAAEAMGAGSHVDIQAGTTFTLLEAGVVAAKGVNGLVTIDAPEMLAINSGGAVLAGADFDSSSGTPVAIQTGAGADAVLTSDHEIFIGGTVTTADQMTITAGTPNTDHSDYFAAIGTVDPHHYLIGEAAYSLLVTGTLTTLASNSELKLTAPDAVIFRGNVNVLGNNSDLLVQSDKWVYVEGFMTVKDGVKIYGGLDAAGTSLGGANTRGSSVYVHTTSRIVTSQAGSQIDIRGAQDVDIFGVAVAGGSIGALGVTWAGEGSQVTVSAGEQAYLMGALLASGSVQLNGGTGGADDHDLGVVVDTAGGLTSGGLGASGAGGHVGIHSAGNLEMMGNILSGGTVSGSTINWAARNSDVRVEAVGQAFIGGHTTNQAGDAIVTGGIIQANQAITVVGGTHAADDTGVFVQAASELTTHNADGSILIQSASDADVPGVLLPGGQVVAIKDADGNVIGRRLENFGGNSTLRIEAAHQIRVGTELQAGKRIDLVGGVDPVDPDPGDGSVNLSGRGIVLFGSAHLKTWANDSVIALNAPGRVDILAPAQERAAEAAGWIATADGVLESDVTLDLVVDQPGFQYSGSVVIQAADTEDNTSITDLVADIQAALNGFTGYTVTSSTDPAHAVGSTYTEFAADAAHPDISIKLKDGRLVFASPVAFQIVDSSVNADLLGLTNLASGPLVATTFYAIEASTTGSKVSIGSPTGPNQKLYIAGKVLAHDEIELNSGHSPDGIDIDLDYTGVLETIDGSIEFDAGDTGVIKGDVLARGATSDVVIHSATSLTIAGLLEADRNIVLTAGTVPTTGQVSILTQATSAMRTLGTDGEIHITGLNDVVINSSIGPGSTDLALLQIEATEGVLTIAHESGRLETGGLMQLSGAMVDVQGVVRNLAATAAPYEIDIDATEVAVVTGDLRGVGSIRIHAGQEVDIYNTSVEVTGAGEKIRVESDHDVFLGSIDLSGAIPQQLGAVLQATGAVEIDAGGMADIAAGVQLLASGDDSVVSVTGGDVGLVGSLYGGARLVDGHVQWTGRGADVHINATEMVTIGGLGIDDTGSMVNRGGSAQATGTVAVNVSGGSSTLGLEMNALSSLQSDATGLFADPSGVVPLPAPATPSNIDIHTDHGARVLGLLRAHDDGADVSITSGGLLYIDGFVDADDLLAVAGGDNGSGLGLVLTAVVLQTDAEGDEVLDADGNPIRVSGGTLRTAVGGHINVSATANVVIDGMAGQLYVDEGVIRVDTSSVTVSSSAGDVSVRGQVSARDSIAVRAEAGDINVLSPGIVKARSAGSHTSLIAPHGNILVSTSSGGVVGVVDAVEQIHLFADNIRVDGLVGDGGLPTRVVLNSVHDIVVTGLVRSYGTLSFNAGVNAATDETTLAAGDIPVANLTGGNITISAAGQVNADQDAVLHAGGDVHVLADAQAGGQIQVLVPIITQEVTVVDVVTGSRQVAIGTIIVPEVHWVTTTVTEQVGFDTVKIGDYYYTMDTTLVQAGWYNPSTGAFREMFVPGESSSGYYALYDFSYTNARKHIVENGSPRTEAWTPDWQRPYGAFGSFTLVARSVNVTTFNAQMTAAQYIYQGRSGGYDIYRSPDSAVQTEYYMTVGGGALYVHTRSIGDASIVIVNVPVAGWSDKYIRMPNGAQNSVLRVVSQGSPGTWQETVGDARESAVARYNQDKSAFQSSYRQWGLDHGLRQQPGALEDRLRQQRPEGVPDRGRPRHLPVAAAELVEFQPCAGFVPEQRDRHGRPLCQRTDQLRQPHREPELPQHRAQLQLSVAAAQRRAHQPGPDLRRLRPARSSERHLFGLDHCRHRQRRRGRPGQLRLDVVQQLPGHRRHHRQHAHVRGGAVELFVPGDPRLSQRLPGHHVQPGSPRQAGHGELDRRLQGRDLQRLPLQLDRQLEPAHQHPQHAAVSVGQPVHRHLRQPPALRDPRHPGQGGREQGSHAVGDRAHHPAAGGVHHQPHLRRPGPEGHRPVRRQVDPRRRSDHHCDRP